MNHELYMYRCIELALNGAGFVAPNPMVGCVIIHKEKIIGEGFHEKFGGVHAEVNAINSVKDQSLLQHSKLYVNLEPCSHFGKTPPCTDLIIEKKIPDVVIACSDPNPLVAGSGIEKLKESGCRVQMGILEGKSKEINKRFFTFYDKKRPYVILKWAQTQDGFIAPRSGERINISNEYSRTLVHRWRSEEVSVLVGTETALSDNPILDSRMWNNRNSLRVVIDKNLRISAAHHLLDKSIPTIIFTEEEKASEENLTNIKLNFEENVFKQILDKLYELNVQSIFVEGGAKLHQLIIKTGLWDEARIFIAPMFLGDGIPSPKINGTRTLQASIEGDQLIVVHSV